jgi:hypothetical protein
MEVEGKETENTIFDVIVNPNKYFGESDDIYGTKEMKNQFGKVLVDFGVNKLTQ